jgi:hypothetical protein
VHPSWRDLVIDALRDDPGARQRFLSVSAVEGVTLAVSRAGGSTGERMLPLLLDDADWDTLGDRVHQLCPELEDRELARILLALRTALGGVNDPYQARELDGLATNVLGTTRRAWDEQHRSVPVFLLEAWFGANACLAKPVAHPRLAPTWADLHPGRLLLEHPDSAELARTEEWLALAEMLRHHDPAALESFEFHSRDRYLLERLIVTLTATMADEELRPLAESVLARIRVVPGLAVGADSAREIGRLAEGLGRRRWWVPEDIAAPPSTEPAIASASDFHREDVDRVLRDL